MRLKRTLKLGMNGDDISFVQERLKDLGFYTDKITGSFTQNTLISVTAFQRSIGVNPNGIIGIQLWNHLIDQRNKTNSEAKSLKSLSNDISIDKSYITKDGLTIHNYNSSEDSYIKEETKKDLIWIDNTNGGSRPNWTINSFRHIFEKDLSIGSGFHFIIGRKSSNTSESIWDGKILRSFDDKYWSYKFQDENERFNKRLISIGVCNYGPLILNESDGQFYTNVNKPISEENVIKLETPFRGFEYFEKYTDLQIDGLKKLISYLQYRWGIQIQKGNYNDSWFNYIHLSDESFGITTKSKISPNKLGLFPQKEIIQMLNSL